MTNTVEHGCDVERHLDMTRLARGVRKLRFGPEPDLLPKRATPDAGVAGARLVEGTKLDAGVNVLVRRPPRVNVKAFPDAGEAVLTVSIPRPEVERVPAGGGGDPKASLERACRRAKAMTRRYCKANRLTRLGTLTYRAATEDRDQVVKDVQSFWKRLRAAWGGEGFPYLWVLEPHPSGHGWHVHFLLNRLVPTVCRRCDGPERPAGLIRARAGEPCLTCTWGHGFIDMRKIRGRKGHPLSGKGAARQAAAYVAKYLGKAYGEDSERHGRHRYEVAQGFQPAEVRVTVPTGLVDACRAVCEVYGTGAPAFVWRSSDVEDWSGPPVWLVFLE